MCNCVLKCFYPHNVCFCRSSRLGYFALAVSIFGHYITVIHSLFYFLFGISVALAVLALYETYKIHYFRRQIPQLFFALVFIIPLFSIVRLNFLFNVVESDKSSVFVYLYLTLFTLTTALTNRMQLRILIEVNEFKH